MALNQALLSEFENEAKGTRKTLERIPEDRFGWAPHPKSAPLGRLAAHLADLHSWPVRVLEQDSLDIGGARPPEPPATRQEILERFDKNVEASRKALASADDKLLMKEWQLKRNGQTLLTLPKVAVLRGFAFNHAIHHRAQLGVYLRLNDIPVPSIYGPSADENPFG